MSWRDNLGPASFRGAAFYVENGEQSGGRRQVKHQFPFKDKPSFDDMGLEGRTFQTEGFVLGDDYQTAKRALCDALEAAGPGELVHPYYGTRRVVVLTYHVREQVADGGAARFSVEFAEAPSDAAQPTAALDATGAAQDATAAASDAVQAQFTADFVPGTRTESLGDQLVSVQRSIQEALVGVTLESQTLATVAGQLMGLASTLVETPDALFTALSELVGQLGDGAESVLLALYNFDPGVRPPSTTPGRVAEQACFDALQRLVQRLALIQLAFIGTTKAFDSYEAAASFRDTVTGLIDEQAEAASDDTYPAMTALRAAIVEAVPGPDSALPHLVQYTPPVSVPSVVLAYRLYGHLDLELDLVARNDVRDPTRILGGAPLEVLSDG